MTSFCFKEPHIWNKLPNVVVNPKNNNQFILNLDKYWSKSDILYNYEAQLLGMGNIYM